MAYGLAADPARDVVFWGLSRLLPLCPFRVRTPDTLLVSLARIHALTWMASVPVGLLGVTLLSRLTT